MPRKNLTTKFVDSIKVETRAEFWDETMRGLTLRVSPSGAKSWSLVWTAEDGKKRLTLGNYPAMDLAGARQRALSELKLISDGDDPSKRKAGRKAIKTFGDLADAYVERYAKPNKRTWAEDDRILKRDVRPFIGDETKIDTITRRDILDVLDRKIDEGKPIASRVVLAVVRKLFNWATAEDFLPASPVAGVKPRAKPQSRDRVLNDDEIRHVWQTLDKATLTERTRRTVRLCFLTGQRVSEVAGMVRSEVDLAAALWTMPPARTKNGREHSVPLSAAALEIVTAALTEAPDDPTSPLFANSVHGLTGNGTSHAVADKLQIAGRPNWTPHDARRTMATRMAEDLEIEPHHIEAVLNHVSGHRAGVAGVYNRSTYLVAKRRALDAWAAHLDTIVRNQPAKIIPIRKSH